MKSIAKAILFILLLSVISCRERSITLFMIGDSTMANKPDPEINPETGWGQLFQTFFDENVLVENHAVNGRSSKSFIDEGRWNSVLKKIRPGDYVFIQFGHNDEKEHDPNRYTDPKTSFRKNLEKFVCDTRSKGGIPVLISPIVRRKFTEDSVLTDTHGLYPLITRMVATEYCVFFLDLQLKTEELVSVAGPEESKKLYLWIDADKDGYYPKGKKDDTHLSKLGAKKVGFLATECIKEQRMPLANYIKNNQ